MSLNVTFNGSMYIIPETGEVGWGGNTTSYLVAIAAGALQKTGGSFTLSAEIDFGASFGVKSLYYKSRSANIAATGILRLNNNSDAVSWRNFANGGDLPLTVDASDRLSYNGNPVLTGTGPSAYVSSITGTANQVIASAATGPVTLSLPQSINSTANVQFGTLGLGSAIVTSSILSLTSTTLGFLPPRMTTVQRDAIATPGNGLFIYNTSTGVYNYYNGSVWVAIAAGGTINAGLTGFFSYYPANGTTLDDQALLSTDLTNISLSSGQYLSPTGSAALPTYSFTGDPNTGMFRLTADQLSLAAGGVEALTVSASAIQLRLDTIESRNVPAGTVLLRVTNTAIAGANTFGIIRAEHDNGTFGANCSLQANLGATNIRNAAIVMNGVETIASQAQGGVSEQSTQINVFNTVLVTAMNMPKTGEVQFLDGTAALPSLTFQADTNTGIYRAGSDILGLATGGSAALLLGTTTLVIQSGRVLRNQDGSVSVPSYSFDNDTDTGIYRPASNAIDFVAGGISQWRINTSGFIPIDSNQIIYINNGSVSLPSLAFNNDTNTGLYSVAADDLGFTIGGTLRLNINSTGLHGSAFYATQSGTAGGPIFSFDGDTNTGIYRSAADALDIACGGTSVAQFATTGVGLLGTTTNNNAVAGNYGEFVQSIQNTNQASPGTNQWFDITSISLTAGDWDVWIISGMNTADYTTCTDVEFGIGTVAGNTSPGAQITDWISMSWAAGHLGKINQTFFKRFSISATTTVYSKAMFTFSAGTKSGISKIWARRVR